MSAPLLSPCCGVEVKIDRYYLPDEWYVCRACSWRFAIGRLLEERAARSVAPVRGFQDARTSLQMAVEEDALARARGVTQQGTED